MNQAFYDRTSQSEATGRDAKPFRGSAGGVTGLSAYHPDCSEAHDHKPTKALIGLGLLVVLSFLLYEFNGKSPDTPLSAAPQAQHQNFAFSR